MAAVGNCVKNWACASVCTSWSNTDRIKELSPLRHSDYRDHRPVPLAEIYETYKEVVHDGKWTMGLLEMWCVGRAFGTDALRCVGDSAGRRHGTL